MSRTVVFFLFFKQKTAYEMRISDWSSDVCSSDLVHARPDGVVEEHRMHRLPHELVAAERERHVRDAARNVAVREFAANPRRRLDEIDGVVVEIGRASCRERVCSVRVASVVRLSLKKQNKVR